MATARQPAYLDRIVVDPKIMLGKPTIRGTRIPVELVLEQLSYNLDPTELFAAYPRLTEDDVKACLAYARQTIQTQRTRTEPSKETEHRSRTAV
jgi:uncharacterized protein (DUF433 family)